MSEKFEISAQEYQEKKYQISKDILASVLTHEYLEKGVEFKRRVNLIFNCILVANNLMDELGYHVKGNKTDEGTSIRKLQDILDNKE
ncbi:MAG: hypothetical protein K2Q18_05735 [Bdellovibrionales bacterium]|nr:hypothetical protein [Bdellovibrionales bacterium]